VLVKGNAHPARPEFLATALYTQFAKRDGLWIAGKVSPAKMNEQTLENSVAC
jgi:hypothetical protein